VIDLLFSFILLLKDNSTKEYIFTTCCSGPLYGPADRHRILKIRETAFLYRDPPVLKIVAYIREI
jgi:hypothetical protein